MGGGVLVTLGGRLGRGEGLLPAQPCWHAMAVGTRSQVARLRDVGRDVGATVGIKRAWQPPDQLRGPACHYGGGWMKGASRPWGRAQQETQVPGFFPGPGRG